MINGELPPVANEPDPKWLLDEDGVTREVFDEFCFVKINTFPSREEIKAAIAKSDWSDKSGRYTRNSYIIDTFIDQVAGRTLNFAEMITEFMKAAGKDSPAVLQIDARTSMQNMVFVAILRNVLDIIFPGKGYAYLVDLAFLFSHNPRRQFVPKGYLDSR